MIRLPLRYAFLFLIFICPTRSLAQPYHWYLGIDMLSPRVLPWVTYCVSWDNSGKIWAGTEDGLFCSKNHGSEWNRVAFRDTAVRMIAIDSLGRLLVEAKGVRLSTDGGYTWVGSSDGIVAIGWDKKKAQFIGASSNAILYKSSSGKDWVQCGALPTIDPSFIICDTNGTVFYAPWSYSLIYSSSDEGLNWKQHSLGVEVNEFLGITSFFRLDNGILIVATGHGTIQISRDNGGTWEKVFDIHLRDPKSSALKITSILVTPDLKEWLAVTDKFGLIRSYDSGITWDIDSPLDLATLWNASPKLIQDSGQIVHVSAAYGLWDSYDFGRTWKQNSTGINPAKGFCFSGALDHFFMGTSDGIFHSLDGGREWEKLSSQLDRWKIVSTVVWTSPLKV